MSRKKPPSVAVDNLSASRPACITPTGVGVSEEEVEFRVKCLQNLKSKIVELDKRPLPLFLTQKNKTSAKGWLRKALYRIQVGKSVIQKGHRCYSWVHS
jgi:hypothetical protein